MANKLKSTKSRFKIPGIAITLAMISLISGVFNGLIGAGGGLILSLGLSAMGEEFTRDKRDVYFNSQASMILISTASLFMYTTQGATPSIPFHYIVIPALAGGIAGGILSSRINAKYIRIIFGAIVTLSGARMVISSFLK